LLKKLFKKSKEQVKFRKHVTYIIYLAAKMFVSTKYNCHFGEGGRKTNNVPQL